MNSYWNNRYQNGGNSGEGSYNDYATHKASVVNNLINKDNINIISEYGCGDGNQVGLFKGFKEYHGYDISPYIISKCKEVYKNRADMYFYYEKSELPKSDLSLSLDVIYHIMDDKDLENYLIFMFNNSDKYVLIFSSNHDNNEENKVKDIMVHRIITDIIKRIVVNFELVGVIDNNLKTSAKFFLYKKTG